MSELTLSELDRLLAAFTDEEREMLLMAWQEARANHPSLELTREVFTIMAEELRRAGRITSTGIPIKPPTLHAVYVRNGQETLRELNRIGRIWMLGHGTEYLEYELRDGSTFRRFVAIRDQQFIPFDFASVGLTAPQPSPPPAPEPEPISPEDSWQPPTPEQLRAAGAAGIGLTGTGAVPSSVTDGQFYGRRNLSRQAIRELKKL
jgi:hypothetical protein